MKSSWKLLSSSRHINDDVVLLIVIIPEMLDMFGSFHDHAAVMSSSRWILPESLTLMGYLSSGLTVLLIIIPMVFSIIRGTGVARYVDRGSMASLLAAPEAGNGAVTRDGLC
jgi:ABC-type phosphate transport system permease subunit